MIRATPPKQPGFVLILVVLMISMISLIVVRMTMKLIVFDTVNTILVRREQAKLLAWSGVELALSKLLEEPPKTEKGPPSFEEKMLFELRKIITICNRWRTITLTEESDGIEGGCTFYIACENGKLPPERFAQAVKSGFKDEAKKIAITPADAAPTNSALTKQLTPWGADIDVAKRIDAVMTERSAPLTDVTDLLTDDLLKKLSHVVFLSPHQSFALTDLFSTEREGVTLQPWALSRSLAQLFDLHPTGKMSQEQWKTLAHAFTSEPAGPAVWDKLCAVLYGEQYNTAIRELYPLFHQRFEADLFSVISYGSYTDVVVMLYAIVQRKLVTFPDGTQRTYGFVKRVYWIYDEHKKST